MALHSSLQRLALFQDFASQLAEAGLAQEMLTLTQTSRPWTRMLSSEEACDASLLTRQCIMMDRVQEYMHLTGLMLGDACFSRNAAQIGLLPTLLKTWPPPGFDQPRFFTSPTLNQRAIGCSLELLTIVYRALAGSHFDEWLKSHRNGLVEWLLVVLTWQLLLRRCPTGAREEAFQECYQRAWGIYGYFLKGGQGVRSKLAKKMRATCAELLSGPEARLWSQDLRDES
jgi:hypothetical protein